jgi:hypothetical protein
MKMSHNRRSKSHFPCRPWVVPLVSAVLLAATCLAWAMMPSSFDPRRVTWTELEYRASKLGFSTTSRITLESVPSREAAAAFHATGNGHGLLPDADKILKLRIATSVFGRDSISDLWFDPVHAVAYQTIQLTTGKRHRYRAYRFADRYVHSYLRKPEEGQQDLAPDRWTNTEDQRWPHPSWAGQQLVVTSPSALFYILATADLSNVGDTVVIPVFSRTAVNLMRIRVEERNRLKVNCSVVTPGAKNALVKGRRDTIRLSLRAQSLDASVQSDFKLLGLQGDVEIDLDPQYRVPLEIRGTIPRAGKVKVKLRKIILEKGVSNA